jgi:nitrite reductase/ring-hydroxylating ferredoxin subunit
VAGRDACLSKPDRRRSSLRERRQWRVERIADASTIVDAGAADDLAVDQMKLLRIGDHDRERRIVLARTERGYAAFDDRCTHKGGPLSDGTLACGTVQCPWHGSQFDVLTGGVKEGPATKPIASYAVEERNGRVFVIFDDRRTLAP